MGSFSNTLISCLFLIAFLITNVNCSQEVRFSEIPSQDRDGSSVDPIEDLPKEEKVESFTFNDEEAPVDILFVVDNSTSMKEEQRKLGQRLSTFIASLKNVDWQIGITTTDVSFGDHGLKGDLITYEGLNKKVLNANDNNYADEFLDTVVRKETNSCGGFFEPSCPSSDEQPLRAIQMAVEKANSSNTSLFRNDADFVAIILSDEDENSTAPTWATKPNDVLETVRSTFGSNKTFTTYGVIVEPGDVGCYNNQVEGEYGTYAYELSQKTGGRTASICDEDYSTGLKEIGNRVSRIANSVTLSDDPIPGSIQIQVSNNIDLKWSLEGRKIIFKKTPTAGTTITVTYLKNK